MSCWVFFNSPHTGGQSYQPDVPQIPTACISVEDAEMMSRMSLHGTKIVVHLKMGAKTYPDSLSFNTVAEIVGSKYPEQVGENIQKNPLFVFKNLEETNQKTSPFEEIPKTSNFYSHAHLYFRHLNFSVFFR